MTLGSDVSRLSTNAANAAAQGLSIVVPLYNEAAGLAPLHARPGGARLLRPDQLGRAAENPRRRRRLPPAVAAGSCGIAATARAQPLLQGPRQLDRLPPDPRRLRTRSPRPRHHHLQPGPPDR